MNKKYNLSFLSRFVLDFISLSAHLLISIPKSFKFGTVKSMVLTSTMILLALSNCLIVKSSNSQQVIATAGGYVSASSTGSLSFTIGETVTPTFTSANNMLTQGFQQPYKLALNIRAFLQGYYAGASMMEPVLYNQGVIGTAGILCDTITVELHQATTPYNLVSSSKQLIRRDGWVYCNGLANIGSSYYIVLKHRNTLETWSANAITISEITNYDFTTDANKAYGNNQAAVGIGKYALYSGDLVRDDNIDLLDMALQEQDIEAFLAGYYASDLNGDGNVDLLDNPLLEGNVNGFVFAIKP